MATHIIPKQNQATQTRRSWSGTLLFWLLLAAVPGGLIAAVMSTSHTDSAPEDPDRYSVGRLEKDQCMSGPMALRAGRSVVNNTNWTKVEGAATFDSGTKDLIGQMKVFSEMKRLGTQPCADLRPLFERYSAAMDSGKR